MTAWPPLSGTVESYLEKYEAADIVNRTNGVTSVSNNLEVESPELTYYAYEFDPIWALTSAYDDADWQKDSMDKTDDKTASTGNTGESADKSGSVNIPHDNIDVSEMPDTIGDADAELIENIEDELFWSPFVDGDRVDITGSTAPSPSPARSKTTAHTVPPAKTPTKAVLISSRTSSPTKGLTA